MSQCSRRRRLGTLFAACVLLLCPVTFAADVKSSHEALHAAASLYRSGNPDAAIRTLRTYLESTPEDISVRVELARYLAFSRRYQESRREYNDVLGRDPQNIAATLGIAKIHSWEGDFPAALELYDKILARSPQFYDARVGKAFTLLWMGEKAQAAEIFRWAARVHPNDREILEALSELGIAPAPAADPVRVPATASGSKAVRNNARSQLRASAATATSHPPLVSSFPEPVAPAIALGPNRFSTTATALVVSIAFVMWGALVFLWRNHTQPTQTLDNGAPPPSALSPNLVEPAPRGSAVLIADRNASALEFQRTVFASAGFEVVGATTPNEILAALRQHRFDHVVLDSQMHEVVAFIRNNLPSLAQCMLLTAPTPEGADRVKQSTGLRCIAKPLRMAELFAYIRPLQAPVARSTEHAWR